MATSEFRWNKKRKHYAYVFKRIGEYCMCILISTDMHLIEKKHRKIKVRNNIPLTEHPNPNLKNDIKTYYLMNHRYYVDHISSFSDRVYQKWRWNINDKRVVKRLEHFLKYKTYFDNYAK